MSDTPVPTPTTTGPIDGFAGETLRPGDPGYDSARAVFNGMIDRRPAVIARCTSAADVAAAIGFARAHDLVVSVYGGGHGVTGAAVCDAGVCIDLRPLKTVAVDPGTRTARVGGGVTWGELDAATQEHDLAVTGGRVSTTGVAGLALGSGSGWLERALGFTCDNLRSAEVVTADGRIVTASNHENPDLFWALRGGSGNFGVVTSFEFGLHPVGPVILGGMLLYPVDMAGEVARHYREFMAGAPDELGGGIAFITAPPVEAIPEPVRGHPVAAVIVSWIGPLDEGEAVLGPLLDFGPPGVDLVQPMPYVDLQRLIDDAAPKGRQNYWTADFYDDLPDEAIDTLVKYASHPESPHTQIVVLPGGGAVRRVPDEAMAFSHRRADWNIHYLSMWDDPADTDRNVAYTTALAGAMKPWATGGPYLNFIGDEGPARVAAAFGPEKFARLQSIKARWDPDNLFRHNQNIPPA